MVKANTKLNFFVLFTFFCLPFCLKFMHYSVYDFCLTMFCYIIIGFLIAFSFLSPLFFLSLLSTWHSMSQHQFIYQV